MKKVLLVLAPVVFVMMASSSTMLATGCGGGGSGGSGGGSGGGGGGTDGGTLYTCDASPAAETAQTVFTKVATPSCNSCHSNCPNGAGCAYGDYSDATKMYNSMVGHASIYGSGDLKMVLPNDLAHSTVYLKVVCSGAPNPACMSPGGESIGASMPQNAAALPADQIKTLKDWICRGAPQN
jgi:hypothetical protein